MKKLIVLMTLSMTTVSFAACTINLQVKKEGAKTSYVNGVSVSKKIQEALRSQCTLKTTVMSKEQIKEMTIASLEKRLAKVKAQ